MAAQAVFDHFSKQPTTLRGRPHAWLKNFEASAVLAMCEAMVFGADVLDLGAGDGYYARRFVDAGAAYVQGLDFCPQFTHVAERWNVRQGNFEVDDLELESYDLVSALGVLEFLREPLQLLHRLAGGLRAGAHLLLLYPPPGLASDLYLRYHRTHGVEARTFKPSEIAHSLPGLTRVASRRLHPYAQADLYVRA